MFKAVVKLDYIKARKHTTNNRKYHKRKYNGINEEYINYCVPLKKQH